MTTVTTHNPARADVASTGAAGADRTRQSRGWALAGLGAALAGLGTIVTSSAVDVVYRDEFSRGSVEGAAAALKEKTEILFVFHTVTALSAVLVVVFGAGLYRRLRAVAEDSLAPVIALLGLAGTGVVSILGSGLDTEFMVMMNDEVVVDDGSAVIYNHWIATIPWLWTLAGLAGLAIWSVARRGGAPRWLGLTGLVLGGLTVLLGISPLEYMAGMTGVLWLLVTAIGFTVGDKAFRASR